jgi:hypothetical protein
MTMLGVLRFWLTHGYFPDSIDPVADRTTKPPQKAPSGAARVPSKPSVDPAEAAFRGLIELIQRYGLPAVVVAVQSHPQIRLYSTRLGGRRPPSQVDLDRAVLRKKLGLRAGEADPAWLVMIERE